MFNPAGKGENMPGKNKKKCPHGCGRRIGSVKPNASVTCGHPECVSENVRIKSKIKKREYRQHGITY